MALLATVEAWAFFLAFSALRVPLSLEISFFLSITPLLKYMNWCDFASVTPFSFHS